jgi:hypothetical protein
MNESELKVYCLEHAGETLPPEAQALLQRDPALQADVARLVAVRNLVSLKRYEQPSSPAMERCLRAVGQQLRQEPEGWASRLRAWFTIEHPALAYGTAALALIAVTALVLPRGPASAPVALLEEPTPAEILPEPVLLAVDEPDEADIAPTIAAAEAAFPNFDKPIIFLRSESTNLQPSVPRMQIGPGQVVPVSFEY